MNQVILNLAVNAAHTIRDKIRDGEKGLITITTRNLGDKAEISVADTGMGIPESVQTRVSILFSLPRKCKGTGHGLALAYAVIVKKHGGKIWFETKVGQGTVFFLQLPLWAPLVPVSESVVVNEESFRLMGSRATAPLTCSVRSDY